MKSVIKFNELTVSELKNIAKKEKIKGYSKLNKNELIKLLKKYKNKKGGDDPITDMVGSVIAGTVEGVGSAIGSAVGATGQYLTQYNVDQCKCMWPSYPRNSTGKNISLQECQTLLPDVLKPNGKPRMKGSYTCANPGCGKQRLCIATMCRCKIPKAGTNSVDECKKKSTYTCQNPECYLERPCSGMLSGNAWAATFSL